MESATVVAAPEIAKTSPVESNSDKPAEPENFDTARIEADERGTIEPEVENSVNQNATANPTPEFAISSRAP